MKYVWVKRWSDHYKTEVQVFDSEKKAEKAKAPKGRRWTFTDTHIFIDKCRVK